MQRPLISFLYCTVRPEFNCYLEHPEWSNLGRLIEMLDAQTFKDFELIVVDGLHEKRFMWEPAMDIDVVLPDHARADLEKDWFPPARTFPLVHVPPSRHSPWVQRRKVAISAFRNTGLAYAAGELVVNLDDCVTLPTNYAAAFAAAWRNDRTCLAMCWPGDGRRPGRVEGPGRVFGFGSYPLDVAVQLNGYNEAFDGAQGLEDMEWSTRLHRAGVRQALISLPGFVIEPQARHSADAINLAEPVVKCCNVAWHVCQVEASLQTTGLAHFWGAPGDMTTEQARRRQLLTSPCALLNADDSCQHHGGRNKCAYLGWARQRREDVFDVLMSDLNPVINLAGMRWAAGREEYP